MCRSIAEDFAVKNLWISLILRLSEWDWIRDLCSDCINARQFKKHFQAKMNLQFKRIERSMDIRILHMVKLDSIVEDTKVLSLYHWFSPIHEMKYPNPPQTNEAIERCSIKLYGLIAATGLGEHAKFIYLYPSPLWIDFSLWNRSRPFNGRMKKKSPEKVEISSLWSLWYVSCSI